MATVFLNGQILKPMVTKYRLEEVIGRGSFAEVFRAVHVASRETVAVKCFRQHMKLMGHFRSAAKEIAFLRILNHPNIIQIRYYELNKDFVYIATEYAEFGSLREYLKDRGPCEQDVIQFVMKQLLSALDYMHHLGILHGDIKIHNILCTNVEDDKPVIKIGDFGLSELKLVDCDLPFQAGSLMYMAPEVLFRNQVDQRCDLWSAGVVMYVMMFGRTLYDHTEKDKELHIDYIRREVPIDFNDNGRYTSLCSNLVRGLLRFDKKSRLSGVLLRMHPFIELKHPPNYGIQFIHAASEHIHEALDCSTQSKYGDALVLGLQAIQELKIQYNLSDNAVQREYFRYKWTNYEELILCQERLLILSTTCDLLPKADVIDNKEFRKHLLSTPKLLHGYDIACNASMYLLEGEKDKALSMFHDALQILLPLMKTEPRSNRKEILGRKMRRWIDQVELISLEKRKAEAKSFPNSETFLSSFMFGRKLKCNSIDEAYLADVSIMDSEEGAVGITKSK